MARGFICSLERKEKEAPKISDYTNFNVQYNSTTDGGTDASPVWTGTAITFAGSSGANEIRFAPTGGGQTTSTPSASWPLATKPPSGTAVFQEAWAFVTDTGGKKTTYTGDNTVARVFRWNWDASGTFASAPQWSAFDNTSHPNPSPGTQPSIVNGSADTSNTSYMKGNSYGRAGVDTPAAGSAGSNPSATTRNITGSVSPGNTAWLTTWQDLQGFTAYIINSATPPTLAVGTWYFTLVLFYGANISATTYTFCITIQYTWT